MNYIVKPDLKVQQLYLYADETYRVNLMRVRVSTVNTSYFDTRIDVRVPNLQQTA